MRIHRHISTAVIAFFFLPLVVLSQSNSDIFQGSDGDGHDHYRQSVQTSNGIFSGSIGDGHDRRYYLPQPSNSIFAGSFGDGHDHLRAIQLSASPIFSGTNGDGHDRARFIQSSGNMIFAGSDGDGHDARRFRLVTSNTIFSGGIADGHDHFRYLSPSGNTIFSGGEGDGHFLLCYTLQANSGIFLGSIGDGHDSGCFDGPPTTSCPADINEDGMVDIADFLQFNSVYGTSCSGCPEDINGDGEVDMDDFIQLNSAFGSSCQESSQNSASTAEDVLLSRNLLQAIEQVDMNDIHPDLIEKIVGPLLELGVDMDFSIFPNPNSGHQLQLIVERNTEVRARVQVEVYDARGRSLFAFSLSAFSKTHSETITFDRPLSKGLYFIHLNVDGERAIKKFEVL